MPRVLMKKRKTNTHVIVVRTVPDSIGPNIPLLFPLPNAEPISAPFPFCSNIITTSKIARKICNPIKKVSIIKIFWRY